MLKHLAVAAIGVLYMAGQVGAIEFEGRAAVVKKASDEQLEALRQDVESGSLMFDLGVRYNREGNFAEAAYWWRKAAEREHMYAQNILGGMYADGRGVQQDYDQAARWWRKAAEQGVTTAKVELAGMYISGEGVQQDDVEAARWYRKAAEQGNTDGQTGLGYMYQLGRGVQQDDVEAARWWRKAAEQGDRVAQGNLGAMYISARCTAG